MGGAPSPPGQERYFHAKLGMSLASGIQRGIATPSHAVRLWLLACLLLHAGAVKAASSPEDALRARVQECYVALTQGDWKKVEKCLTKESKPYFRNETKKPLVGYQIGSIKIDSGGRTATVVMQLPVVSIAAPQPILISKPTVWRLIGHTWYFELPRPGGGGQQGTLGLAPNPMMPNTPTPKTAIPPPVASSPDLKFESTWSGFGRVRSDAVKTARFNFTNVSQQVVTLAEFQLSCDCLRLKTQQMQYKPGESGTLEIELDVSKLRVVRDQSFQHEVVFKTEPDGAYVKLMIAAFLLAPNSKLSPSP